jgi:hypothetical protein
MAKMSLGGMAALATIIAIPIAILTIPQANDYVFKTLLHSKSNEPRQEFQLPPQPTFTPPDLEGHKWTVSIRASGFPAFEGSDAAFLANHDYMFLGKFLVPTGATDQHIDCPSNVSGHWDYAKPDHTQISLDMKIAAIAGRTPDEYAQCMRTLNPLVQAQQKASATCTFINSALCTTDGLEIHLTAQ